MKAVCPKCHRSMTLGFTLDLTHAGQYFARWVEGVPEKSFWAGGVVTKDRDCREIETYRCEGCGYLESYAVKEATPPSWKSL